MVGGKPKDFLDRLYSCQDTVFIYKHIKYWFQGYMPDKNSVHMEIFQYQPSSERNVWEYDGATIDECLKAFIHAKIWNGKSFWDVEQEMEWVDC